MLVTTYGDEIGFIRASLVDGEGIGGSADGTRTSAGCGDLNAPRPHGGCGIDSHPQRDLCAGGINRWVRFKRNAVCRENVDGIGELQISPANNQVHRRIAIP